MGGKRGRCTTTSTGAPHQAEKPGRHPHDRQRTSYTDATASNGTTYYYKVTAVNSPMPIPPPPAARRFTVDPAPSGTFIDAGGPAAGSYSADANFSGGATFTTSSSINTSADTTGAPASVYQSERYGNFNYSIPGLVAGSTHKVNLHFAENYWTAAGQRVFNVSINGQQVLSSFDIFATAGGVNKAVVQSFNAVANSAEHPDSLHHGERQRESQRHRRGLSCKRNVDPSVIRSREWCVEYASPSLRQGRSPGL